MILIAYQNTEFSGPITYMLNLIFSVYQVNYQVISYTELSEARLDTASLVVSYGKQEPEGSFENHIHIYESPLFGRQYLQPESLPKLPLQRFKELPIIYPGGGPLSDWVIVQEDQVGHRAIKTTIDIVASSFFMLTRYEEVIASVLDKFDRFPASASLAFTEGFLDRPIVNEYIELLWKWVTRFNLGLERKEMWDSRDFALCLTHDVDILKKYHWYPPLRTMANLLLRHGDLKKSSALAQEYLSVKLGIRDDPYDTFDYLIKLSEKYGFSSSFYFMSGGETDYDGHYEADTPQVVSLMKKIQQHGFEIGLHTSFDAYKNPTMIASEKTRLERNLGNPVLGGRQHYLRWKTPASWRAREDAGLKYDTSLSFADQEGFRAGMCLPYKPFDVLANRVMDIWELPLIVMDGTLHTYQKLSPEEGFNRIKNLINVVKRYKGVFVILWHNSSLDWYNWPGWRHTYEGLLDYLGEQNVLGKTALEIIQRWESRSMS